MKKRALSVLILTALVLSMVFTFNVTAYGSNINAKEETRIIKKILKEEVELLLKISDEANGTTTQIYVKKNLSDDEKNKILELYHYRDKIEINAEPGVNGCPANLDLVHHFTNTGELLWYSHQQYTDGTCDVSCTFLTKCACGRTGTYTKVVLTHPHP